MLKPDLETAICLAAEAHRGGFRKGTRVPYIFHPLEVGMILAENECRLPLIIAGILHDTLEETNLTLQTIKDTFGNEVAMLVFSATEPDKSLPWRTRKEHTLQHLAIPNTPEDMLLVACADKLSNARSLYRDYIQVGDALWSRFNAGYADQKWYYEGLVKNLARLGKYRMYRELQYMVGRLFSN